MVFLCLGLSVFSTIEENEYEEQIDSALYNLEIVIVIWFGLEFIIRYVAYEIVTLQKVIYKFGNLYLENSMFFFYFQPSGCGRQDVVPGIKDLLEGCVLCEVHFVL